MADTFPSELEKAVKVNWGIILTLFEELLSYEPSCPSVGLLVRSAGLT